jgi:ribose transport system substrate-binding protein
MLSFRCRLQSLALALGGLPLSIACKPDATLSIPASDATKSQPSDHSKRVICLFSDSRVPFQQAQAQFLNLLDSQDPDYQLSMEDARGDPDKQLAQVKALTTNPPAVLLLQPANLTATMPSLANLKQVGTRIIVFDPPSQVTPSDEIEASIACDPSEIGRTAAKVVLHALSKRALDRGESIPSGRVLEIRGSDDSPWSSMVHAGFADFLKPHPSITLVHDAPADWTSTNVALRYSEALRIQKSVDVVFAHDDFLAQAAHSAAITAKTRDETLIIGINGFAGSVGGLEMMQQNEIDATVQRPFLVDRAWELIKNPSYSGKTIEILLPPRSLVPADLDNPARLNPGNSDTPNKN